MAVLPLWSTQGRKPQTHTDLCLLAPVLPLQVYHVFGMGYVHTVQHVTKGLCHNKVVLKHNCSGWMEWLEFLQFKIPDMIILCHVSHVLAPCCRELVGLVPGSPKASCHSQQAEAGRKAGMKHGEGWCVSLTDAMKPLPRIPSPSHTQQPSFDKG